MLKYAGLVALGLFACGSPTARADELRLQQYEQVVGEFDQVRAVAIRASEAAKTEEEQRAIRWPKPKDYAPRLMELAEAQPKDQAARQAMLWVLEHNVDMGFDAQYAPIVARAADLLLQFHKDAEAVGFSLLRLTEFPSPPRDHLLRAMDEQTTSHANRGRACLALAQYLKMKGTFAQQLQMPGYQPDDPVWLNRAYGTAYLAALRKVDPAPLLAEAERLYERVLDDYATLDHLPHHRFPGRTRTLGAIASNDLDELRHLAVGQPAPEITGEDVAGNLMKLSDYRGKVVVLTFWGSWCGACMALIPHEKSLAERMSGRPFALVGVNSDKDRAQLQATIAREGITWRSWFDGGKVGGPIARAWNVPYWPMVYVIDHRGIIRAREVSDHTFIAQLAADLVAAAERDAAPHPPAP